MNWEVILWTCITIGFLLSVCAIIVAIIFAKGVRKRREALQQAHMKVQSGMRVMFAGGVYGNVVEVKDNIVYIEISKDVIVEVSRYSIHEIKK
jgi:preprotein translocase subunit YajC